MNWAYTVVVPRSREGWIQVHVSFVTRDLAAIINEEVLDSIFSVYGEVADITIKRYIRDLDGQVQSGYGFIFFLNSNAASTAVKKIKKVLIQGVTYDSSLSYRSEKELMTKVDSSPKDRDNSQRQSHFPLHPQQKPSTIVNTDSTFGQYSSLQDVPAQNQYQQQLSQQIQTPQHPQHPPPLRSPAHEHQYQSDQYASQHSNLYPPLSHTRSPSSSPIPLSLPQPSTNPPGYYSVGQQSPSFAPMNISHQQQQFPNMPHPNSSGQGYQMPNIALGMQYTAAPTNSIPAGSYPFTPMQSIGQTSDSGSSDSQQYAHNFPSYQIMTQQPTNNIPQAYLQQHYYFTGAYPDPNSVYNMNTVLPPYTNIPPPPSVTIPTHGPPFNHANLQRQPPHAHIPPAYVENTSMMNHSNQPPNHHSPNPPFMQSNHGYHSTGSHHNAPKFNVSRSAPSTSSENQYRTNPSPTANTSFVRPPAGPNRRNYSHEKLNSVANESAQQNQSNTTNIAGVQSSASSSSRSDDPVDRSARGTASSKDTFK